MVETIAKALILDETITWTVTKFVATQLQKGFRGDTVNRGSRTVITASIIWERVVIRTRIESPSRK